jgi:hypothetical protein
MDNQDESYTPEELAWKLILDEKVEPRALLTFSEDNTKEILFEILITIFLEMIFDHSKLQYLENNLDNTQTDTVDDNFNNFKLDLTKLDFNQISNLFVEKIKKLKYLLCITELSSEDYTLSKKYRYCTVLLKDSPSDATYFMMNEEHLDPDKRYHFALNGNYKKNSDLRDICCTVNINGKYIKIYFVSL